MQAAAAQFANSRTNKFSWDTLANMNDLSKPVQDHLGKVYNTLATALLAATAGAFVQMQTGFGGGGFTMLASIGVLIYLLSQDSSPQNESNRFNLLLAFAALQGAGLGPLVSYTLFLDASLPFNALMSTTIIFGCFSAAAIYSPRRKYLYVGGICGSALSLMMWFGFINMFIQTSAYYYAQLYLGLFVFMGYVVFDTQMMIEKADAGDRDYIKHTLELFQDFVAIFVRLLVILAQNSEKKEKKKNNRR